MAKNNQLAQPQTRWKLELAEDLFGYIKPLHECIIKLETGNAG
jgi:hypothetical protein